MTEGVELLFVIGAPRSGTTMLERMLSAHSMIHGGPEPHLLTPLAHLGVWANVEKAPYDHILAAESQKRFVQQLPEKEQDYWRACRAYCDVLYGRYMEGRGERICLDKTPAYALILPFLAKVYPDAHYVVLTRHPLALFSSYANSFFNGEYEQAQRYNPILNRYVPALAAFLRQEATPKLHVRYEDLVKAPKEQFGRICEHVGLPFEAEAIEYGKRQDTARPAGLGDPIGVQQHRRPSTGSLKKWVQELASDTRKREMMQRIIAQLDPDDLAILGYPLDTLWKPLEEAGEAPPTRRPRRLNRYQLQRRLIVGLRARAQKGGLFRRGLEKLRLAADVLLRE